VSLPEQGGVANSDSSARSVVSGVFGWSGFNLSIASVLTAILRVLRRIHYLIPYSHLLVGHRQLDEPPAVLFGFRVALVGVCRFQHTDKFAEQIAGVNGAITAVFIVL